MRQLREWASRAWSVLRPTRDDADLEAELRSHLALAAEDGGVAGNVAQAMDALRDQRGVPWLDDLRRDIRYGVRMLWRDRGLSVIIVTILAAGIGSATAIYSLVDACILRHNRANDDRWVVVRAHLADRGTTLTFFSVPELADARRATDVFESVGAISGTDFTLSHGDFPERVLATYLTADIIPMLGTAPLLGRIFSRDEDRPGAPHIVVISYPFWQEKLAGDPDVLRRTVMLNDTPYAVVGVMPPHYDLWGGELWVPFQLDPHDTDRRTRRFWIAALLRRGVSEQMANARLAVLAREQARAYAIAQPEYAGLELRVWNVRDAVIAGVRPAMLALLAAVGLLLLTACANVANLLLARATARQREISVRAALGAGRGRIVRQLLAESLLIAATAGALGIAAASAILPLLVHLIPDEYLTTDPELVRVNAAIAVLAAAVSIATGLLFGLVPALRTSRPRLAGLPQRGGGVDRRTRFCQYTLSTVQIALTLLVAVAAVLTIEVYRAAERTAIGFNPTAVVSAYVALPAAKYPAGDRIAAFYRTTLAAIQSQPGVIGAAAITDRPLGYRAVDMTAFELRLPGHPVRDGGAPPASVFRLVSPAYFAVMQTPVIAGRVFSDSDDAAAAPVAIANEAFVAHFLDGAAPLGQQLILGTRFGARNLAGAAPHAIAATIVGVVTDSKQTRVIDAGVRPELFLPIAQHPLDARSMALVVRTSLDTASAVRALREGVKRADPGQPVFGVAEMADVVMRAFGVRRLTMVLLFCFAVVSVSLAAIGLYAVINFGVQQRTQEIGVRMAVGASAAAIVRMVIASGVRLGAIGVAVGLAAGGVAASVLESRFTAFGSADARVFAAAAAALLAVAALAAWIPARRAARVDPLSALRADA